MGLHDDGKLHGQALMHLSRCYCTEGSLMKIYSLLLSPNLSISSGLISKYLLESNFSPFNIVPFVDSKSITYGLHTLAQHQIKGDYLIALLTSPNSFFDETCRNCITACC